MARLVRFLPTAAAAFLWVLPALWLCPAPSSAAQTGQAACEGVRAGDNASPGCFKPGETFKDCEDCPTMTVVPPGTYEMGSPDAEAGRADAEGPRHAVTLRQPLAIGTTEVTFAQWDACVRDGGCEYEPRDPGWGRGKRPAVNVSWNDITQQYLPWLSAKTGRVYRLPTEAEWEYAARAGTVSPFNTGETISTEQANYDGTNTYGQGARGLYRQRTMEAGSFAPNAFGLYDMHGNVSEWVSDCYVDGYAGAPADGAPRSDISGCSRVLRGGSWIDHPRAIRSAYRARMTPTARFIFRGFRVAREP